MTVQGLYAELGELIRKGHGDTLVCGVDDQGDAYAIDTVEVDTNVQVFKNPRDFRRVPTVVLLEE